jgi:hypothetical protein
MSSLNELITDEIKPWLIPSVNKQKFRATSNQIILGNITTTTINSVVPSANRIYTVPDAGVDCDFVLSGSPIIPSFGSIELTDANNQINFSTNDLILSALGQSVPSVIAIQDIGSPSASFITSNSVAVQIINSGININGNNTLNDVSGSLILGRNGGGTITTHGITTINTTNNDGNTTIGNPINNVAISGAFLNLNVSAGNVLMGNITGASEVDGDTILILSNTSTSIGGGVSEFTNDTDATSLISASVIFDGGIAITKTCRIGTGIYLPSLSSPGATLFNNYAEGTTQFTMTGPINATSVTVRWQINGKKVSLHFPTFSVAGNSAGGFMTNITGTLLPISLLPDDSLQLPIVRVQNNGSFAVGMVAILTSGEVDIYSTTAGGSFAAAGGLMGMIANGSLGWILP